MRPRHALRLWLLYVLFALVVRRFSPSVHPIRFNGTVFTRTAESEDRVDVDFGYAAAANPSSSTKLRDLSVTLIYRPTRCNADFD